MATEPDHNQIIAASAREALSPLGFWRKGKSRVWLADRGFWLSVVEFQPSGFSKGSYLNVAAHWLWGAFPDSLSFDFSLSNRKPWVKFKDAKQFSFEISRLAEIAANESRELEAKIGNLESACALLLDEAASSENPPLWPVFHAAVAAGLRGDMVKAREMFRYTADAISDWRPELNETVAPYGDMLDDKKAFAEFIIERINEQRRRYKLEPYNIA